MVTVMAFDTGKSAFKFFWHNITKSGWNLPVMVTAYDTRMFAFKFFWQNIMTSG
jgi:hypothetical protein